MKKIISLLLVLTMALGLGAMVFADTEVCELDQDEWETVFALKSEFVNDKLTLGEITQTEADELLTKLENRESIGVLRELGFGMWLRDTGKYDEISSIVSHKNMGQSQANQELRQSRRDDANFVRGQGRTGNLQCNGNRFNPEN